MAPDQTRCRGYEDDWSALLDGELPPARAAELTQHVSGCDRCRARVESLRRVDALLAARVEPALPADLRVRLQARIDADAGEMQETPARPRTGIGAPRRRLARELPVAAALAAAAAAVAYLVTSDRPVASEEPVQTANTPSGAPEPAADLAAVPVEDVAVGLELETVEVELESPEDLDVIANLELLEALLALEEDTG